MPKIETVQQAQDLRDKMVKDTASKNAWHTRLEGWRSVRDRTMDDQLDGFKAMLPLNLQAHWVPSQTPVVDDEIESLKAILAANEPEVQVVALLASRDAINVAQEAEPGIEALHHELWPIELRMARYDAMLGDAVSFNVTDRLPPGEEIAKYADRESLQTYAEKPDDDEKTTDAQRKYRKHYEKSGDHDTAYNDAMAEAKQSDRVRWQNRVLDMEHVYWFEDEFGVSMFCEVSKTALAPVIETLEGYGVKNVDNRLVIKKDGKAYEDSALGTEQFSYDGECNVEGAETVTVTHIRTRECTAILVEGLPGDQDKKKDGLLITFPSPFPVERHTCGAYITAGRVKKRGRVADRYEPVVMPLIVTAQQLNIAKSVQNALIYAESARDTIQQKVDNKIPPLEGTLASKSKPVKDAKIPVSIQGEIVRIPTTGIELAKIIEMLENEIQSYRSREFFSGTGSSGEPALHLARLQTAQLTKLVPLQTRCATTDKKQIMDILAAQAASGESLYLHTPAPGTRGAGAEPEASEPLKLTPEMCQAALDVVVKIGADTPESTYAMQQVSMAAVDHGDYGMTEHRNRIGIKDPWQTVMDQAIDSIVFAALGTVQAPGTAITGVMAMVDQRAKELVDSLAPILAPPPPVTTPGSELVPPMPPEMSGGGMPPGMIAPPTQTVPNAPGGIPANPGATATAV